jgi:sugar (pentulose or hexulose) kinase
MVNFQEPFVLLSTGTWCISLNPFNDTPLTVEELKEDCLCYLTYQGRQVKASRLFAGNEHEEGIRRLADFFQQDGLKYRSVEFNAEITDRLQKKMQLAGGQPLFAQRNLAAYASYEEAYHQLMLDIMVQQVRSTKLVTNGSPVRRLFVDGGFGKNPIYMNLLAAAFPQMEIYAASMAQATSLGAALAIHTTWNKKPVPNTLIQLQYYSAAQELIV